MSKPGVMEGYLQDRPGVAVEVRKTFAGLWGLDNNDAETNDIIQVCARFTAIIC